MDAFAGESQARNKYTYFASQAKKLNGEIISADSMQIYKNMNIGTAKPTEEEKIIALNLIGYDEDSIARLMTPLYVQVKEYFTVKQVFEHIKKYGTNAETLSYIFIVDEQNKLIDDLKIGQLLLADENTLVSELMDRNFISIITTTKIEDAFEVFDKYDRNTLPIVTENGTNSSGIIPPPP